MTKKHFIRAAEIVRAIQAGHWTNEPPSWVPSNCASWHLSYFERAVWTAEAFIILFTEWNPRFDSTRFLIACGLVEAPVKVKRSRQVA